MDIQASGLDEHASKQPGANNPLTYEETPPIEPVKTPDVDMFPPPRPRTNLGSIITTIIVFILLFIVGFWLSGSIRKYIGNFTGGSNQGNITPTPTPKEVISTIVPTTTGTPSGVLKSYQVLNGRTRVAYEGISFILPSEVAAPTCDGSSCGSQGTYLPGGTRFTVALRGTGQVLPDYRGKVISDLGGIAFPLTDVIVDGVPATEYSGTFVGKTVGGYVFTQMRGYMIPITEDISFEINHFAPQGVTTDFAGDDLIFNDIMQTLKVLAAATEKGGTIPALPTTPPESTTSSSGVSTLGY